MAIAGLYIVSIGSLLTLLGCTGRLNSACPTYVFFLLLPSEPPVTHDHTHTTDPSDDSNRSSPIPHLFCLPPLLPSGTLFAPGQFP
jgi:hypothetical protein